jgi:hypothetical protein
MVVEVLCSMFDATSFYLWSRLLAGGQVHRRGVVCSPHVIMLTAFLSA